NWFRVYTNADMLGVELAGATKNVIAIAAGIIDGLQAGDNAKAALLTRGLVEITRLGVAMGARQETFAGLSGMGDLVTTCFSPRGRNRSFGQAIATGQSVQEALDYIPGQVEGVNTCRSLMDLARQYEVEMPITHAVYEIIFQNKPVPQAINELMTRQLKAENAISS
ncbi:MAG: NAD(P)H-dependent glycerol-3-phosphate dehydrogenase, partial [Sedimentisphaerales bacterium]|nr:NAD(P)H-dependent glycerol-3-phosphate dehydrogenase [Sedimentisphaerales bacterium]